MYGIWIFREHDEPEDFLKEARSYGGAILAFRTVIAAENRACLQFGYADFQECASDGWCEIRPLTEETK